MEEAKYVSKHSRRYDAEFKQNAVDLVLSGRLLKEVARDLGVSTYSLRDWVKRHQAGEALNQPKTLAEETLEQRENRRLRQELAYVRTQRDILKKALAIVSDGNLNSASNS
jgi:transposase-like protein